jgi:hypothetical protein
VLFIPEKETLSLARVYINCNEPIVKVKTNNALTTVMINKHSK